MKLRCPSVTVSWSAATLGAVTTRNDDVTECDDLKVVETRNLNHRRCTRNDGYSTNTSQNTRRDDRFLALVYGPWPQVWAQSRLSRRETAVAHSSRSVTRNRCRDQMVRRTIRRTTAEKLQFKWFATGSLKVIRGHRNWRCLIDRSY